jgi:hydrogenase expression/formation protein HypD
VYSPLDALDIAEQNPDRPVIFMGVGFETTTPTIAAAILEAEARGLLNFSVYCAHKTTPPALRAIANDPETAIDGFILPGHVATITGLAPFGFLVVEGQPAIDNAYRRGVNADGNPVARQLVEQVFEPCDTTWRGLGSIAASGLAIRPEFSHFDASMRFDVSIEPTVEPRGCRCGDVLRGAITPSDCPLFGRTCTPEHPVGPCMVSSEGSCAAYYRYRN